MNIIDEIKKGAPFVVNFKNRSLKVNKKYVIKNGEPIENLDEHINKNVTKRFIEDLFFTYYTSKPEVGMPKNVYYQKRKLDEMDDSDMICGSNGHVSRFMIEFYTLIGIINSSLNWALDEMNRSGHFFWKSDNYRELIILKEFFNYAKEN